MGDKKVNEVVTSTENTKEQPKKLTYEELANTAHELQKAARQLYEENAQLKNNSAVVRVGFLFEVLKYQDLFPKKFVFSCTSEIEDILTIPEEKSDNTKDSK